MLLSIRLQELSQRERRLNTRQRKPSQNKRYLERMSKLNQVNFPKEKEDLTKELEKFENEAQDIETRRMIQFIKSNSTLASWPNLSLPAPTHLSVPSPLISIQGTYQVTPTLPSTISTQISLSQPQQPQNVFLNLDNVASTSNVVAFWKKPICMEKYR